MRIGTNSGITIRKEALEQIGLFDESLPAAEDTDLFLRLTQCFDYTYVPQHLIHIHQTEGDRLSKRFDKIARAYNIIIPKHSLEIEKHRNLRLKYYYKATWLNYHLGDRKLARSYFKKLLRDGYFNLPVWIIFGLFEIFGKNIGTKIHTRFSGLTK